MAWNGNFRPLASRVGDHTFTFLYDYHCAQFPGLEVKCRPGAEVGFERPATVVSSSDDRMSENNSNIMEKKRRLTSDQIELLERSFQEEIKLEPDKKMKLSQELGLQPRQVAVWFQNRRARWKVKQLEGLYVALKREFDVISREKQKLQEEVIKLKARLEDREAAPAPAAKQRSTVYTEASAEETVESTSVVICSSNKLQDATIYPQIGECNHILDVEDYNPALPPYWAVLPGYP